MRNENFHKMESTSTSGGYYLALNGRNKKRYEDYSISLLGEVVYTHEPTDVDIIDTMYSSITPAPGLKQEMSTLIKQKGSGPLNCFSLALGVGKEKYFDMLGTNNLLAIGLIPSFFTGNAKIKMNPVDTTIYYYQNYPDTLEYTTTSTSNETWECTNKFSGFSITIPVGFETHLTDRLILRLGVTQDFMLKTKDSYEDILTDGGSNFVRDVTQGTSLRDTTITEPAEELDSYYDKYENKVSFSNMTSYHYGLGFQINDNIELNFLNFAKLTELGTWVLGVNIKL
jgi:hypothetical protein